MGQRLVFLVPVTPRATIPAGFASHRPDPVPGNWHKENKKLGNKGIPASKRPEKPRRNPDYPTMGQISLVLPREFKKYHSDICIQAIVADALGNRKEIKYPARLGLANPSRRICQSGGSGWDKYLFRLPYMVQANSWTGHPDCPAVSKSSVNSEPTKR